MKHTLSRPGFWFIYRAINFSHSFDIKKIDKNLGQEVHIKLRGDKKLRKNPLLRAVTSALWLFPALLAIIFTIVFPQLAPWNYIFAIVWVTAYHFAAMYYVIELSDMLKVETFPLKTQKKETKKVHTKKKK